jgi:hypothetical protein
MSSSFDFVVVHIPISEVCDHGMHVSMYIHQAMLYPWDPSSPFP